MVTVNFRRLVSEQAIDFERDDHYAALVGIELSASFGLFLRIASIYKQIPVLICLVPVPRTWFESRPWSGGVQLDDFFLSSALSCCWQL